MSRRRVSHLPLPLDHIYENEWDIISLPDNFCTVNPIHTSTKIFQSFLKKIQNRHDLFIENLGAALNEINKGIEESIRMRSKALKKDIKYLITSGQNFISYNLDSYQTEILTFDNYNFEKCKKHCSDLIMQGRSKIFDYYAFLKGTEKFRTRKFKEIFKNNYDNMLKLKTKPVNEIQQFFEDQILAYNQIVLTNLRNYKEIETHIILVYTNEIKLMLYKITKYEEAWKELCKNEIIDRLSEYNMQRDEIENVLFKNESILRIINLFNTKIDVILGQMEGTSKAKANTWLDDMKKALNDLDSTAKQLITVYKVAAEELYNKYYVEYETIMEKMINQQLASISEINEINETLVKPLNKCPSLQGLPDLHKMWKDTIEFLLEALYKKFSFLEELEKIFFNHEKRINDVKDLIIKDFKQLILKHDNILQNKDVATLNISLDCLRRDSTRNALDNTMKRAQATINKIKQTIEKQKDDQLRVVSKLHDYTDLELNVLKEELRIFEEKYSEEPTICTRKELNRNEYTSMYNILKETRENFNEIGIWKSKIIENIASLIITCKHDQQNKAEQWVAEQEEYIFTNYESKLEFHNCRLDRIKKDIYDIRLAEINKHESRYISHSIDIQKCTEKLFVEQTIFINENSSFPSNLNQYVEDLQIEKLENVKNLGSFLLTTNAAIHKDASNFGETVRRYTESVSTKVDGLYAQNLLFLKSMKLFHEGGNFSSAELKLYTSKIRQLNNLIKKKSTAIQTKIEQFEIKIDTQVQDVFLKFDERQKYIKIFLDFKNDVKSQFKSVQAAIKNVVVETKTAKNKTQTLNDRLIKLLQLRGNPYAYLNYVVGECKELIERFSQHQQHLIENDDAPKLKPVSVRNSSNVSTKKSILQMSRSALFIKVDNNIKLFDNETDLNNKEDKFLCHIRKILIMYVHDFEKRAKKFFAVVKREDCISLNMSHTTRSFMWGVIHKFTYYYLQCLQIWVIEIRDLINLIHNLQNIIAEFCEKNLKQLHEYLLQIMETKCNKYITDVKNNMNSAFANIKNISDQLKPLYGYPGNQKMLEDLDEKVTATIEEEKQFFWVFTREPKKYIENTLKEYVKEITKATDKIEELYKLIPLKDNYKNLVTQVKDIMFSTNFDNVTMPLQCTEIIDNSEIDIGNITQIMLEPELPRTEPKDMRKLFIQIFYEILHEKARKIIEIESHFKTKIPEIKRVWNENMEKVIELYKIKYE